MKGKNLCVKKQKKQKQNAKQNAKQNTKNKTKKKKYFRNYLSKCNFNNIYIYICHRC